MLSFLHGGGEMAEAIRNFDWSSSPLGLPEDWPPVLKTNVGTMLGSRFPQCLFWGPDLIMIYNDGYVPMLGAKPVALGQRLQDAWRDVWDDVGPIADRAMAGEPTFIENFELTTERNGHPEKAWFTFSYSPVRDEFGKVVGVLDTVVETTQTVQAKQRIELLNFELAHRMKNTFSVINAIAAQTFGNSGGRDSPQARFGERLMALASAQDLLLTGGWGRADLAEIVRRTLAPHLPHCDALEMDGPALMLTGRQVFGMALAVHELATNAAKYGAFAVPGGQVCVHWEAGRPGSADPFVFTWEERGVGPVTAPDRSGFGSRLITRILPAEFGGTTALVYGDDGICFSLAGTMAKLQV